MCIENHLFKAFGIPEELSSDNASNLAGPAVAKLLKFDAGWKDVITLASIVVNSVPRPILENHSPYYCCIHKQKEPSG